jgi:hypothetical protein
MSRHKHHRTPPDIKEFHMQFATSSVPAWARTTCASATLFCALFAASFAALFATPNARADAGHDHGAAAPATAGPGLPRFAASSELFELVGVVNGKQLTLYLDHSADNSPVQGARIELELGGSKVDVKPNADGDYVATLARPLPPGTTPVTATVTAGTETDLLAGEIAVAGPAPAEAAPAAGWRGLVGWSAAALALLGMLAWAARRALHQRAARAGAAA